MRYGSVRELRSVVEAFESGKIKRDDWGHPEHLIVAYFYCLENEPPEAFSRMKTGINRLLLAFGIDTTREMPYHETLTAFWIGAVAEFVARDPEPGSLEAVSRLLRDYGKDFPLRFYSRELLFSDRARKEFVVSDLRPVSWMQPALGKPE